MRINAVIVIGVAAIPAIGLSVWRGIAPEAHAAFLAIPLLGWVIRIYSMVALGALALVLILGLLFVLSSLVGRVFRQPPTALRNIHGDWILPEPVKPTIRARGFLRLQFRHGDHGCGLMVIPQANDAAPFALRSAVDDDPQAEIISWFERKLGIPTADMHIEADPEAAEPGCIARWSTVEAHTP